MADNLESYFKKHLSDEQPAKDNWNVPSDQVWDNVLPVIQKKRGLFIPWRYLYILGALIVIVLAVVFWPTAVHEGTIINESPSISDEYFQTDESSLLIDTNNESIIIENPSNSNQYSKTSSSQESDLNAQNLTVTGINTTPTDRMNSASNQTSKSNQSGDENKSSMVSASTYAELKPENSKGNLSGSKNNSQLKTLESNSRTSKLNDIQKDNTGDKISIENYNNAITNQYSFATDQENTQIGKIPLRSIDEIHIAVVPSAMNKEISTVPMAIEKQKEKPINNKGKFGVGASFLPTLTSTYVKGNQSAGQLETTNMLLYSNNWGLELRYYLSNRFTLVTGIGQSEVRSWSKSIVDFGYDSSNEHMMDTGEKENTSAVRMPTPFGEIETNITYRFPGEENIPDGETMQSELETHQEVRYLSIPLGVEFNIIRFSQFNWFAETGIRYNRALKDATEFTSRILHEGHDMDVVGEEMMGHPTFTNYYLDYYLGTGINYQFSKSFQVSGSARYFNSITKVNEQDNVTTHVRGLNFKIGIAYIF